MDAGDTGTEDAKNYGDRRLTPEQQYESDRGEFLDLDKKVREMGRSLARLAEATAELSEEVQQAAGSQRLTKVHEKLDRIRSETARLLK